MEDKLEKIIDTIDDMLNDIDTGREAYEKLQIIQNMVYDALHPGN